MLVKTLLTALSCLALAGVGKAKKRWDDLVANQVGASVANCNKDWEIALLLDSSGSISEADFESQKKLFGDVLDLLNSEPSNGLAIIRFSSSAEVMLDIETSREMLKAERKQVLQSVKYEAGFTFVKQAMDLAIKQLNEKSTKNKLIVMAWDGEAVPPEQGLCSDDDAVDYGSKCDEANIQLLLIGVDGADMLDKHMRSIQCLLDSDAVLHSDELMLEKYSNTREAIVMLQSVLPLLCAAPSDGNTDDDGIDTSKPPGDNKVDYVLLLDSSGSVGDANFQIEKQWASDILERLMDAQDRLSLIRFETGVTNMLTLEESAEMSMEQLHAAVMDITYKPGWTATRSALETGMAEFQAAASLSDDRRKVMLLLTDGEPWRVDLEHVCADEQRGYPDPQYKQKLAEQDICLVVLGIGRRWKQHQEKVACIADKSHFLTAEDFVQDSEQTQASLAAVAKLVNEKCLDRELTPSPTSPPSNLAVPNAMTWRPCQGAMDVALVFNSRTQIDPSALESLQKWATLLMNNVWEEERDRLALVNEAELLLTLKQSASMNQASWTKILREVIEAQPDSNEMAHQLRTAIGKAIDELTETDIGNNLPATKLLVVITDDEVLSEKQRVCPFTLDGLDIKDMLMSNDIELIVLGFGALWKENRKRVECLTDYPASNIIDINQREIDVISLANQMRKVVVSCIEV